jgi:thioredoxin-like negative regulator of GroEL
LASKPAVDGFERAQNGSVAVFRLDVRSAVGNQVATQFGARAVPTFLMFDGQGQLVGRRVGAVLSSKTLTDLTQPSLEEP